MSEFQVRVLLPQALTGSVIGKGGAVVAEIRTQSSARVQIQKEQIDDSRVVDLIGEESQLVEAVNLIFAKLGDTLTEGHNVKVLVTPEQVGKVIGKGGAQVKEIRDGSSCKVKVFREDEYPAFSPDRVVMCNGTSQSVGEAIRLMIPVLGKSPSVNRSLPRGSMGGNMGGNMGMNQMGGMGMNMGGNQMNYGSMGMGNQMGNFNGGKRNYDEDMSMNMNKRMRIEDDEAAGVSVACAMRLNPNQAGRLIGRSGQTINNVRNSSRASVKLSDTSDDVRDVEIEGSIDEVVHALHLIKNALNQGPQR